MSMEVVRDNSGSLTKRQVFELLVEEILSHKLKPGEALTERHLAGRFGLSRTPIREILMLLKGEHLVDFYPNQGAFVRRLTAENVRDLFQLRLMLEPAAAELAARNRPDGEAEELLSVFASAKDNTSNTSAAELTKLGARLHDALVRWSGNQLLDSIYNLLRKQIRLVRSEMGASKDAELLSFDEHMEILEAVRDRESERAKQTMIGHLQRSREALKHVLLGE